jgi:DNA-binding transcriptional ArsR family regulator/uncharacterized protein YndB with AHSA1/START domain
MMDERTHDDPLDGVFKALADTSRRQMLDLLRAHPGLTVGELGEHFDFSRFAVMKHLKILEGVDLVVSRREGRSKRLYLNPMPIQSVHDRWLSQYSAMWASSLNALKHDLETEEKTMPPLKHVFVSYIRTSPELLWQALTDPDRTPLYFHGTRVRSEFVPGSSLEYMLTRDGETFAVVVGEILQAEPGRKLVHTFAFSRLDDAPTKVSYEIEAMGDLVKLTVLHEGFEAQTETYTDTAEGWPPILSGLKTLMETGEPLEIPAGE